ncbi:MAG TPA: DUF1573 domain-containing protein [Saprospiraceae bacterium]|jgi:hypothetical protein|nr:DUF1573 domain-containing protein [Saprospiraceae bacterium]QLH29843.1 MAG: DUF1573 domain-containing protein [Candidatus Parvibacillus calidus]MBX7180135.1 DUF1573 domain-containing protein [Saprospiraceae bacterium]MCB0590621.1 DUF1573 domain-containing protein [Saprospiraceae bacterium]MCO5282821.1 DUF1573 domain-containing protein [Saprospiraceae bacterium]
MKSLFSFLSLFLVLSVFSCKSDTTDANGQEASKAQAIADGTVSDQVATGNPNEISTPTGPTTTMVLDKTEYKFSNVKEGDVVETSIKVTNTGKEPLVIVSCKGSCGCTTPKCPTSPIAPGQSADIPVKFDTHGKPGTQSKDVTITANTVPAQTKFRIFGEVERVPKESK